MRVMRVKECAALPDLGDDRGDDARVESDSPADRVDRHPIFGEPLGELGAGTSNHHLLDRAHPGQLPRQQPDLALSASPLAARRHVHHP